MAADNEQGESHAEAGSPLSEAEVPSEVRPAPRLTKVNYRPIEAAIRWSGLVAREAEILTALEGRQYPDPADFPDSPSLHLAAERIQDAIINGELPVGEDGVTVSDRTRVADPKLTIRHVDLKAWMIRCYPDQRPAFLFSEFERTLHPAITIDHVRTLTFERDSLRVLLAEREEEIHALRTELRALFKTIDARTRPPPPGEALSARAERTLLNIIGGQLELLLGKAPSGKAYSDFRTQESVIEALIAHHGERLGMTKSTLEAKFAQARRNLSIDRR